MTFYVITDHVDFKNGLPEAKRLLTRLSEYVHTVSILQGPNTVKSV